MKLAGMSMFFSRRTICILGTLAVLGDANALAQTNNPTAANSNVLEEKPGPYFGVVGLPPYLLGVQAGVQLDQNIDLSFTAGVSFAFTFIGNGPFLSLAFDGLYHLATTSNGTSFFCGLGLGLGVGGSNRVWDAHIAPGNALFFEIRPVQLFGVLDGTSRVQVFTYPLIDLGWQFRI